MVARLFTCVTVNGRVPLGDEGAALYSHRNPYVIVKVRVAFQLSWANRLQLEKTSLYIRSPRKDDSIGHYIDQNIRQRIETILQLVGYGSGFRIETSIIKPKLGLVRANDVGNVVRQVDLLL
jgi:hypothetical protein